MSEVFIKTLVARISNKIDEKEQEVRKAEKEFLQVKQKAEELVQEVIKCVESDDVSGCLAELKERADIEMFDIDDCINGLIASFKLCELDSKEKGIDTCKKLSEKIKDSLLSNFVVED